MCLDARVDDAMSFHWSEIKSCIQLAVQNRTCSIPNCEIYNSWKVYNTMYSVIALYTQQILLYRVTGPKDNHFGVIQRTNDYKIKWSMI